MLCRIAPSPAWLAAAVAPQLGGAFTTTTRSNSTTSSNSSSSNSSGGDYAAAAPAAAPAAEERGHGALPHAQLAKNILAGHCRAQLTTAVAAHTEEEEPRVASSAVQCVYGPWGAPVVLLSAQVGVRCCTVERAPGARALPATPLPHTPLPPQHHAQHLHNLRAAPQASLCAGHLHPPAWVARVRAAGWLPPRATLLGDLQELPAAEVRVPPGDLQARRRLHAACARLMWPSPPPPPHLTPPTPTQTKHALAQARKALGATSLAALLPSEAAVAAGGLVGYALPSPARAQFVDAAGAQHELDPQEVDSAALDPLALQQHDLLAELNDEGGGQAALRLFCAAYLGVDVDAALLLQADRLGLTLLGQPAGAAQGGGSGGGASPSQRWRMYRIQFQREQRSVAGWQRMVDEMRREVESAVEGARQEQQHQRG